MKILIVVKSGKTENTLQIAEAMSEVAPATVVLLNNIADYNLNEYDIVGFGSGIYYGKHDKELFKLVESLNNGFKYSFVFSTSGSKSYGKNNKQLCDLLESKNKTVLGSFGCRGVDKFFIFGIFGGINKHHPDIGDFEAAQQFIEEVIQKYNKLN